MNITSKRQKIIFLSPVPYFKGGAENSLFDLLQNPNIEPILLAPDEGPILEKARQLGFATEILDFGTINTIKRPFSFMKGMAAIKSLLNAAIKLKKLSRHYKVKIVHSNGLKAHIINCLSYRIGGSRAILHIRDIPYTRSEKLVWHIMHSLCADMVLVSAACWPGETLPRKCHIIHNGTQLFPEKEKIVLDNRTIVLGFVGRIHPAKGLHLLLDWLSAAKQEGLNVRLSIRGSFSEDAPNYKSEIENQINNRNLINFVEFKGHISDPQKIYEGLDIVVVPSQTPDPLPRSVMEAMARGIPVFGYPAGGIFEMIEDGKTGFMVNNSESFCESLRQVTRYPETLYNLTTAARDKISMEFTIDGLYRSINNVYSKYTAD